MTTPYSDDPYFEREVITGTHVIRATLDHTSDGEVYATTQMEPETGPLTPLCATITRDEALALSDLYTGLVHAFNRLETAEREAA